MENKMAQGKFLCYKDENGRRGIVPPGTPYTLRQMSDRTYWLESEGIATLIKVPSANTDCDNYGSVLGYVNDEPKALQWLICAENEQFIGLDT